jgi:hypothetical protein
MNLMPAKGSVPPTGTAQRVTGVRQVADARSAPCGGFLPGRNLHKHRLFDGTGSKNSMYTPVGGLRFGARFASWTRFLVEVRIHGRDPAPALTQEPP